HSIVSDSTENFGSINELADEYYHRLKEIDGINKKRHWLHKRVSKQIEKLSSTLQKQIDAIENASKAERFKNIGDIITANIYRIGKGSQTLVAEDYSTGEMIAIKLDPRISPAANAQKNYKKYNKLKSGLSMTVKRMVENKKEILFLESVQVSLDSSETMNELDEIEYELIKTGVISTGKNARSIETPSVPYCFLSSDGYTVLAGKNNRQNDLLTMKTAAPDDIWVHTKDIPGSHVVITGAKGSVPDKTIFEASAIAATLSKAKGSSKVAVDYTQRKNVRKPNGAKPGMVVYERYNTVLVNPDKSLFEKLLVK
ncbi:MAG: Rqc2 family fibronectin-binding protein, partial [Christensenellales bacterium]